MCQSRDLSHIDIPSAAPRIRRFRDDDSFSFCGGSSDSRSEEEHKKVRLVEGELVVVDKLNKEGKKVKQLQDSNLPTYTNYLSLDLSLRISRTCCYSTMTMSTCNITHTHARRNTQTHTRKRPTHFPHSYLSYAQSTTRMLHTVALRNDMHTNSRPVQSLHTINGRDVGAGSRLG